MRVSNRWILISFAIHVVLALFILLWSPSPTLPEAPSGELVAEIEITGGGQFTTKQQAEKSQVKGTNTPNTPNVATQKAIQAKEALEEKKRVEEAVEAVKKSVDNAKAKATADAKSKAEADAKAQAIADAKSKAEADAKAKAIADAKAKAIADAKAKVATDAKAKATADAKAKATADAKAKATADAKAKATADAKKREAFEQQLAAKLKSQQSDKAITNAINQAGKSSGSSDKTASAQAKAGSGLSFSNKTALIDKMAKCWTEQGATQSTTVDFDLNQTGVPYNFKHAGGDRIAFLMAQEAIKKCGPYSNLPANQYDSWKNLRVKFSPFGLSVQ